MDPNEVPGWLPIVVTAITALAYIVRVLRPFLNEHVEALKSSRVDDLVFDIVEDLAQSQVKEINKRTADGKLTKEEGRELLIGLGTGAVKEILDEVGEHYLGEKTQVKVARKLEKAVSAVKARDIAAGK